MIDKNKLLLLFIYALFPLQLLAQDTLYYNAKWKVCTKDSAGYMRLISSKNNGYAVTDYYYPSLQIQMAGSYSEVNSEKEIENGSFRYFSPTGIPISEGVFIAGKKEGIWKYFFENGSVWYTKNFKNDKQDGDAFTYFLNGSKRRKEVYKNGIFQNGFCFTFNGKDTSYYPTEEMPEFIGGNDELDRFIAKTIQYPAVSKEKKIEGKVITQFTVEPNGKIDKIEIISSPHYSLSTESLRIMSLMPRWKPGRIEGVALPVKFLLPVKFQLK